MVGRTGPLKLKGLPADGAGTDLQLDRLICVAGTAGTKT
jgi:hypothetical protein